MTEQSTSLRSIPLDLLDQILESIELCDIKNVRLTCRGLACIGPRFKSFIANQTTDLSQESLDEQKALASHSQLRSAVKKLVVMATVIDTSELDHMIKDRSRMVHGMDGFYAVTREEKYTDEELSQAAEDLEWMHAKQNRQHSRSLQDNVEYLATVLALYGTLDTIDVDACIMRRPNIRRSTAEPEEHPRVEWQPVFVRASEVYRITTSAIISSRISLKTLLFYRNTPRCSVQSLDVTNHRAQLENIQEFESTISKLENFALSFSTRVLGGCQYSESDPEAKDFPGVASMLKPMTKLDAFDLHMISGPNGIPTDYDKIFEAIADEVKLPVLTQVFIRGLPSSEASLLKFIKNHPTIQDLNISEMHLTTGTWNNIIQVIRQMPALARMSLSNLWDSRGLFNLQSKAVDKRSPYNHTQSFPCQRGTMTHTRVFSQEDMEDLKAGMEFDSSSIGRAMGSAAAMRHRMDRHFQFFLNIL